MAPMNTPQTRYEKANIKKITWSFNRKTDADILTQLSAQANKQGYIKQLIRADIAKQERKKRKQTAQAK